MISDDAWIAYATLHTLGVGSYSTVKPVTAVRLLSTLVCLTTPQATIRNMYSLRYYYLCGLN